MFKKKQKSLCQEAGDQFAAAGESAKDVGAKVIAGASALLGAGSAAAGPTVKKASDKLHHLSDSVADSVRPQIDSAIHKYEEVRPQVTERAGLLASNATAALASYDTPDVIDNLAARLTGDKRAMKKAQKSLAKASKEIRKNTKQSGSGGLTTLIVLLAVGGLLGIAYYVWKKAQPVEDPWSTPLPNNRPADARPVGSTPAARQSTAPEVSKTEVPAAKLVDEGEEVELDEFGIAHEKGAQRDD